MRSPQTNIKQLRCTNPNCQYGIFEVFGENSCEKDEACPQCGSPLTEKELYKNTQTTVPSMKLNDLPKSA